MPLILYALFVFWVDGSRIVVAVFVAAYSLVYISLLMRRLTVQTRSLIAVALLYAIGVALLIFPLPQVNMAQGMLWIFVSALFAGIFIGIRTGLFAVCVNAIILLLIGAMLGRFNTATFLPQATRGWLLLTAGFVFLNLLTTALSAAVLGTLDNILVERKKLTSELQIQIAQQAAAEQLVQQANQTLERRNRQLEQILETGNRLRLDQPLETLLSRIVSNHRELGFEIAVLNLRDEETGVLHVHTVAGGTDEGRKFLKDASYPWERMEVIFREEFKLGPCYFIPAGTMDVSAALEGKVVIPKDDGRSRTVDEWDPEDFLYLPLRSLNGEYIGAISLDMPVDGMRPMPETLQILEIFANQASAAVENARLYQRLEAQLEEAEQASLRLRQLNSELARVAKLKDELLANVSHELRTPLNAIMGFSESLDEGVYGELEERQRKPVQQIGASGQHLLALINDILDVSKAVSGEMVLDIVSVHVDETCQACLQFIRPMAERADLHVIYDNNEPNLIIKADERSLRQILTNLLSNAVKFTPGQGTVGLVVSSLPQNNTVDLSVWDTGIGIAEGDLFQLFEPFIQVDRGLSRQYGGTGLGLALVKRLVELHDGAVAVTSTPGEGSRFTVTLPLQG